MSRFFLAVLLFAVLLIANDVWALPGVAPPGTAIGEYDPSSGLITVSVTDVANWYIEREGYTALTGAPETILPITGGLVTNNQVRFGESNFYPISFTDVALGNIAQIDLPNDGTLKIFWNSNLGSPLQSQLLSVGGSYYNYNYPPLADISGPINIERYTPSMSITLDAGESYDYDNGDISFMWDLDDDGVFEVDTGTSAILEIDDVLLTFGDSGFHPVSVEVSDGIDMDIASTSVFIPYPPPPTPSFPQASGQYDPETGSIRVSVKDVTNWYIESASSSLVGNIPSELPASGGLVSDNNVRIGESSIALFSYEVDLGNVAATGLPKDDLRIFWNEGLGTPLWSQPVAYGVANPEPSSLVLVCVGLLGLGGYRRLTLRRE